MRLWFVCGLCVVFANLHMMERAAYVHRQSIGGREGGREEGGGREAVASRRDSCVCVSIPHANEGSMEMISSISSNAAIGIYRIYCRI